MIKKLEWTNAKRKLSDLIPWPRNPRKIGVEQTKRLNTSLLEFAQVETIAIGPGNEVYNGHQRLAAWAEEYGDIEVDVRVASRALAEKEREKLTVYLHKGAIGDWDLSVLTDSFDMDELVEWGFNSNDLLSQEQFLPDKLDKQDYFTELHDSNSGRIILVYNNEEEKEWIAGLLKIEIKDIVIFKVSKLMEEK